jgi:hypothetical protein
VGTRRIRGNAAAARGFGMASMAFVLPDETE